MEIKQCLIKYYLLVRNIPLLFIKRPVILSFNETISEIVKNKKSFCRYGDGEISLLQKTRGIGFQKMNDRLTLKLKEVLDSETENLLIGLPNTFRILSHHTQHSQIFWYGFNFVSARHFLKEININKVYGDATITRFYMMYRDKSFKSINAKIKNLKTIWEGQDVLIVEGEKTKLGIGNDLFDNVKSLNRILCPSKNAFDFYDIILQESKKIGKNKLILLALGPTATVLTYDLAKEGFWAVDIGHIDVEYLWFLQGAKHKLAINGKQVNESKSNENVHLMVKDDLYEQSILKIINK